MNDAEALLVDSLTDAQISGLTLFGESRAEAVEGRIAVANVLRNRVRLGQWGRNYRAVCLAPKQFSCWSQAGGVENFKRVMDAVRALLTTPEPSPLAWPMLRECLWLADGLLQGRLATDNVHGATSYYAPLGMVPKGSEPYWAKGHEPVAIIGGHRFYRGV